MGLTGFLVVPVTWLRDELIDDAVEFLLCEEVVVAMEEDGYVVVNHQSVNWFVPCRPALIEAPSAIYVMTSHFIIRDPFDTTTSLCIAANELMAENELKGSIAIRNGLPEPKILLFPQCPIPAI